MRERRSDILDAIHQAAKELYEAGAMDAATLCEFDRLCLSTRQPIGQKSVLQQTALRPRAGPAAGFVPGRRGRPRRVRGACQSRSSVAIG